ncbi:hypothetical protein ACQJBY_018592 [Aegilops geniculata]
MRGKGAAADVVQEALPTCGCHIERYRHHDAVPRRRPVRVGDGEGTSAAGAEEASRTCGSYTDTPPRRPTPVSASTALGIKGGRGGRGLKNKRDEMPVEVSRGGVHSDGFEESVARCGFRNPSLVRRCATPPRRDSTRCAQMGACIPVAVGRGRGHKDTHDDYYGTSTPRAAELHAPTADLRAEVMAVDFGPSVDMEGFNISMEEARQKARNARYKMYDTGSIEGPPGSFTVNNVQVFAGYVLHTGSFLEGPDSKTLSVGDEVKYKEVIGDRIDQKGPIALPEKLIFDFSHGKPVQPEDLQKIESIVKQRIEAELERSAQEIKLANPKSVNGLRAVFGEIYPDPVRVVSIGRKLEDVLANPESKEWLSDINEASKLDGATLEKKIGSINNTLDAAAIPAARKADLKGNVSKLEDQLREAKKKTGKENVQKAAKTDIDAAEAAVSKEKLFCVTHAGVGLDTTAAREAVVKPMDRFKDADKKQLGTIGEEVKQLAQRARDNREANNSSSTSASIKKSANNTVQILVKFCGATIPVQENLDILSANMLIDHVCRCAGVSLTDLYSTFCGRILEPNKVLSYYQLQKDSMVYINPRLRGGSAGRKNWDDIIITLNLYHGVALPWDLLLPYQSKIRPAMKVWYLDHPLQVRCQKVLIYLGRKHYVGICFGGFTSKQIFFDADDNAHIDAAPQEYSQELALLDYGAVSGIFDDALEAGINKYPTYFYNLLSFLSNVPAVDLRSKVVIAFVTNHPSLLTYSRRIQITAVLDMLLTRLSEDDSEALIAILENFYWGSRLDKVPAMYHTYFFHWWYGRDGTICTPYEDNGVSLLKFSNNFFKHQNGFPLEKRDAAFALATKHKNYLPQLLFSILIRFKDPNKPCPPSVQAFIDEVIVMLGDHTVDCEIAQT